MHYNLSLFSRVHCVIFVTCTINFVCVIHGRERDSEFSFPGGERVVPLHGACFGSRKRCMHAITMHGVVSDTMMLKVITINISVKFLGAFWSSASRIITMYGNRLIGTCNNKIFRRKISRCKTHGFHFCMRNRLIGLFSR